MKIYVSVLSVFVCEYIKFWKLNAYSSFFENISFNNSHKIGKYSDTCKFVWFEIYKVQKYVKKW